MLHWKVTPGRRALYWALQLAGWGLYFAYAEFFILATHNTLLIFVQWPIVVVSHMAGSHVLHAIIKGRRWIDIPLHHALGPLLLSMLLIDIGVQAICFSVAILFHIATATQYAILSPLYLGAAILLYSIWTGIYFAFEYSWLYRDSQLNQLKLQSSLQQAELAALRSQINPHFLFNCLNNVRSLIAEDAEGAREMLLKLSELMRHALAAAEIEQIPLETELRVVEAYLDLQKLQFENRLHWAVQATDDSRLKSVPPMLLQQLVENAVKHGIAKLQAGGEIHVAAEVIGRTLELRVENTGELGDERANGVGLKNARERLFFMGGAQARLDLEQIGPNRVRARVLLPLGAA